MNTPTRLLTCGLLLAVAAAAFGGTIAVQDGSQNSTYTASATISYPFTVTAGASVLVVGFASSGVNPESATTLTYAGQPLTQVGLAHQYNGTSDGVNSAIYYLWNPPVGTSTISGTAANAATYLAAYTLTGVDTTTAPLVAFEPGQLRANRLSHGEQRAFERICGARISGG